MKSRTFFVAIAVAVLSLTQAVASAADNCSLRDKRICVYNSQLQAFSQGVRVTYQQDSTVAPSVAAEHEWVIGAPDIIHLGDTLSFSDEELLFLLAHEYGHAVKKHGRQMLESVASPEDRAVSDMELLQKYKDKAILAAEYNRDLNHQQEYEADAFAVLFMASVHVDAIAAMQGVLKVQTSSSTHPSRRARIAKAKQVLEAA